jgi:hypothetical protein
MFTVPPSHTHNDVNQRASPSRFVSYVKWFLDRLSETKDDRGVSLIDQTGILISSELGRFPYINALLGKDRFPTFSAIMMGPGLAPGQFGQSNAELEPLPVSRITGKAGNKDHLKITLDDLARTILEWVDVTSAEARVYRGRRRSNRGRLRAACLYPNTSAFSVEHKVMSAAAVRGARNAGRLRPPSREADFFRCPDLHEQIVR